MLGASESAVPVFLFLGLVLVFIPVATLICICLQRRHKRLRSEQSRAETAERVAENLHRWSNSAPIEMGTLQAPPLIAIKPIRGMVLDKRPVLYTQSAPGQQLDRPRLLTALAPPTTVSAHEDGANRSYQPYGETPTSPSPFHNAVSAPSAPPHSPRYNLQVALDSEASAASIRSGHEFKPSLTAAPRVKSLKASPEEAAEAFHADRPALPAFESAYFAQEQQQARWI